MALTVFKRGSSVTYVVGASSKSDMQKAFVTVNNIDERNRISDALFCYVKDARSDSTVNSGWALYAHTDDNGWIKVAEQESVDALAGLKKEIAGTIATKSDLNQLRTELVKSLNGKAGKIESPEDLTVIDTVVYTEDDIVGRMNKIIEWINNLNPSTP